MLVRVLLLTLELYAPRGDADMLFRHQIADAITRGTDDEREQTILARLAWYEGSYSKHVASCKVTGDHGKSLGLFQVQPRSAIDRLEACGTLDAQVRVALRYMRHSFEVCSENAGAAKLNLYTSGDCRYGGRESALRWGSP